MAVAGADNTEKAMKMAQQEMDYRVDLYNRFAIKLCHLWPMILLLNELVLSQ